MNNEQIYAIVSQGLNVANQKGCFNLEESHQVGNALITLQKILVPQGIKKEELPELKKTNQPSVKPIKRK